MNRRISEATAVTALAALALFAIPAGMAQSQDKAEAALKAAMDKEVLDGNLKAAIDQYKRLSQTTNKGNNIVDKSSYQGARWY